MGIGTGCLYACAPLTLLVAFLLFLLSVMLRNGNWTFEVLAAKNKWNTTEKSRCCKNGGILCFCISIMLWSLVLVDSFFIQLDKLRTFLFQWWLQRRHRLPSLHELLRERREENRGEGTCAATDVVVNGNGANHYSRVKRHEGVAATRAA
ncbi:hypothetical protein JKF63_04836 [Porcisia hertigi]|uniref:Uncharacterized protein n=1 Tax=Porcisia hertigi TaxID=2761500 RepID=A0A836IUX1_9TRYP|nr:hypothetical protein JKF63_04836 [Porcisia hertigi]